MVSPRFKIIIIGSILMVIFNTFCHRALAQEGSSSAPRPYVELSLVSNYVDKGITQTEKSPAFQTQIGQNYYNQGHLFLFASNVSFPGSDSNLLMKGHGSYRFIFSPNFDFTPSLEYHKYFKPEDRDQSVIGVEFGIFGYKIVYEKESKFEGLNAGRTWFGVKHTYDMPWTMKLDAAVGYSQIEADGFTNYFDTRLSAIYKIGMWDFSLTNTYNSSAAQFEGRGALFFIFGIGAHF